MFVLSKGSPRIFNPIKEKTKYCGSLLNYNSKGKKKEMNKVRNRGAYIRVHDYKIKSNIWSYNIGNIAYKYVKTNHPAVFPYQLAYDHIISWTNENDIVLDCFMGSGTTGVAAIEANRKFIGIEKNEEYFNIAKGRIDEAVNHIDNIRKCDNIDNMKLNTKLQML